MNIELSGFRKLFQFLRLERVELASIYFYATLSGLVQLSLPLGIQAIIGFVLGATMVTSVYVLIFFIVLGTFVVGLLRIKQMNVIEKVQQKIFVRYAFAFTQKVPHLDSKGIDHYYLPEKINRFFEVLTIQKGITKMMLDIPVASIQIVLGLLLLSFYHPLFIVFDVVLILIVFIMLRFTYKIGLKTSLEESNHKYSVVAWLQEMGRVVKSLKFSQGDDYALKHTDERTLHYVRSRTLHYKILAFQYRTIVFFKVSVTALMLILGTYLLFNQSLNIGEFVAVEIVIITVINSLEKIITKLDSVYDVITGLIKMDSLLDIQEEEEGTFRYDPSLSGMKLEFRHVNFSYEENQRILEQISFTAQPNSITMLSGEEGSGKSTILKLMTGMYKADSGILLINDVPIQNYSLQALRQHIGVLLQQHDIFEGSVYDNITLGRSNISVDQIMLIAHKLGIEDFISQLPKAFETTIDPLGRKLPVTLVKKILLLRALVGDPCLILLEDPCLGLEAGIKQKTLQYLNEIKKGKTIIISGNDPDFIAHADRTIYIENGMATIKP